MSRTPTQQQADVIAGVAQHKLVKIKAGAGAGKTSTLQMVAETQKVASLYLAFNKVTAEEGTQKFPSYVTCQTTHSLAYRAVAAKIRHKLSRPQGKYTNVAGTGSEIARYYKIDTIQMDEDFAVPANFIGLMVKNAVARFEQSADAEVSNEHVSLGDLAEKIRDRGMSAATFVRKEILTNARKLWKDRIDPSSVVLATHDTYLKMYQLSKPTITGYEILYVDEFQDTTPCVLDLVMNQQAHMKIVMVGDPRQAIYGWRGAVNAMQMVEATEYPLTKSFRYGQAVADVATAVLEGAMVLTGNEALPTRAVYTGMEGGIDTTQPYTRLFRTNSGLLSAAIEAIKQRLPIAIEIDVKDFVKLLQSAEALHAKDTKNVKHDKFLAFTDWEDAVSESKHDPELKRIVKIVNSGQIGEYIRLLANFNNYPDPLVTFTTAHKSKGREWHQVRIEDDFRETEDESGDWIGLSVEEQNLLYVASTRAQYVLEYNMQVSKYINRWQNHSMFDVDYDTEPVGSFEDVEETMTSWQAKRVAELLVGHDHGMSLRGEQAQYAAMQQEGDLWPQL